MLSGRKGKERANFPLWSPAWIFFLFILGLDRLIFFVDCVLHLWLKLLVTPGVLAIAEHQWQSVKASRTPLVSRLGWARSWEGPCLGQLVPIDCRDILCHVTSCSARIPEGTDGWLEGAYCLGTAGTCLLLGHCWKVPIAWALLGHQSALWGLVSGGKYHLVVFLLQFPLRWINCVYLDPYVSLLFLFSPMSHHCGRGVSRHCKISICCLGLSHHRVLNHSAISFCIRNDVILNMVPEETTHHL